MKIQYMIRPEFPMGPSTVFSMPLDMGFMRGLTVQDHSQSQNHGKGEGSTGTPLPVFPGFTFTKANRHRMADVIDDPLVTAFPVSMASWVKCNAVSAASSTISIADKDADTQWVALGHTSGGLNEGALQSGGKAQNKISVVEIDDNVWHLIGLVFPEADRTTHKLYLDGAENLDTAGTEDIVFPSAIDRWSIGRRTISTTDRYFEGTIGQCWVWTDERSDVDMRNLYELTRYKYGV